MDNQKVIDKIKKLLELANSPVEAEARLAFKMAQDLISKYSISITEDAAEVVSSYGYMPNFKVLDTNMPWIANIAHTISKMFGCQALYYRSREQKIQVFGFKTNASISIYAIDSILNQLRQDLRAKYNLPGYSLGFWEGAAAAIDKKFAPEVVSGTGLVLYDKVREYISKNIKFGSAASVISGASGRQDGYNSGSQSQIRSGIQNNNQGRLLR